MELVEVNLILLLHFPADYIYWRTMMSLAEEGPMELVEIAYKFVGAFQGTTTPPPR